jgi:hypothetical protein
MNHDFFHDANRADYFFLCALFRLNGELFILDHAHQIKFIQTVKHFLEASGNYLKIII